MCVYFYVCECVICLLHQLLSANCVLSTMYKGKRMYICKRKYFTFASTFFKSICDIHHVNYNAMLKYPLDASLVNGLHKF